MYPNLISGGRDPAAAGTEAGDYFRRPEGVLVMGGQESTAVRHAGPESARSRKTDRLMSRMSVAGYGHGYVVSDDARAAAANEAAGAPVGDDEDAAVRVNLDDYSEFGRNVAQHSVYASVASDTRYFARPNSV